MKPVSDKALLAVCELLLMTKDDQDQFELAEYMLCDMTMTRKRHKASRAVKALSNDEASS